MRLLCLGFCLAVLVLSSSCHSKTSVGVRLDSTLSSYVPATTTLLAGIDVDGLTASGFYKRHADQLNVPALNAMAERVGVDPRRDLSSILVAFQTGDPLILAKGRFDAANIAPHLLSLGGQRSEYRKQSIFGTSLGPSGDSLFFPAKNVVIGGPSRTIRALIDRPGSGIPQILLDRVRQLPKTDQLWAVSSQGLPLDRVGFRSDVRSALSNFVTYVSGLNAGIALDAGAHLQVDLQCTSSDDAKQVHDALRGGIGLARLTTRDNQLAMLKLYDAIQVTYEQQTVHVRADLSPELADQLLNLIAAYAPVH